MALDFPFIRVLRDCNSHGGLTITGMGRLCDCGEGGGCLLKDLPQPV